MQKLPRGGTLIALHVSMMEKPDHTKAPLTGSPGPARAKRDAANIEKTLRDHTGTSALLRTSPGNENDPLADIGPLRNLEELFWNVSHAGKNFLGPIKGYTSLIQDDNSEDTNTGRWSQKIMHNIELLEQYLERLSMLLVKGATTRQQTSWSDVISKALGHCRYVSQGTNVEITNRAQGAFVQCGELLVRALFQLLRNASESAGGGGRVWLNVSECEVTGNSEIVREFTVTVRDNGPGIEASHIEDVWKPFYTTRHDHLGLGLPYVAMAAPVIGMQVDIKSNVGKGTTVTLILREQGGQSEA